MIVYFTGKNNEMFSKEMPLSAFEIRDIIDRVDSVTEDDVLTFRIAEFSNASLPNELRGKEFKSDIYKLNALAEKISSLQDFALESFRGLLKAEPTADIDRILQMAYGASDISAIPCSDEYELGEMVIENELMPEFNDLSDEMLEALDRTHVGKMFIEKNGGFLSGGYYCDVGDNELPEIELTINKEQGSFFRVLASPNGDEKNAQWYEIPTDKNTLIELFNMKCHRIQSVLPMINEMYDMSDIYSLNDIAERLKAGGNDAVVKLKAIMEAKNIQGVSAADYYSERLGKYRLDRNTYTLNEYGHKYLEHLLPELRSVRNADLSSFAEEIMTRSGASITSYGALSGQGTDLYPNQNDAQEQEEDEDMDEDEGMIMGGICQ